MKHNSSPERPEPRSNAAPPTTRPGSPLLGLGRRHKALGVLLSLAMVVGIGWGGWRIWNVWANRHAINQACADLVPAGKVADLPLAGGRISHNDDSIDLGSVSGSCSLFSTEAGDKVRGALGKKTSKRMFFAANVSLEPNNSPQEPDDHPHDRDSFMDQHGTTYLDNPIGGGISGVITDSGVRVKLPCEGVRRRGKMIKNVVAMAHSPLSGDHPFSHSRQMSQETRDTLASIAVDTANRLGEELGCSQRLPAPPRHLLALKGSLINASDATGTCAWYAKGNPGDPGDWLPDQVMETRTDGKVWTEKCGLAMSQNAALATWKKYKDRPGYKDISDETPLAAADWWASTQSFFGEPAKNVRLRDVADITPAKPGSAGRSAKTTSWWASSVCQGQPAVHALTIGFQYSIGATSLFEPVFRAYVNDVAKRRGCTNVKFPGSSDFKTR
jgi:hypothetical protein